MKAHTIVMNLLNTLTEFEVDAEQREAISVVMPLLQAAPELLLIVERIIDVESSSPNLPYMREVVSKARV